MRNVANIITSSRILGTALLPFFEVLSIPFNVIYVWCGLSDVLDGFVARKTKTVSELGSKLDSASDLFFYTVMMLKVWKYLKMYLPGYVWTLIYLAVGSRFLLYVVVGYFKKIFLHTHSVFNKTVGGLMFFLPFVVKSSYLLPYSLTVLSIAFISTINEIINLARAEKA